MSTDAAVPQSPGPTIAVDGNPRSRSGATARSGWHSVHSESPPTAAGSSDADHADNDHDPSTTPPDAAFASAAVARPTALASTRAAAASGDACSRLATLASAWAPPESGGGVDALLQASPLPLWCSGVAAKLLASAGDEEVTVAS